MKNWTCEHLIVRLALSAESIAVKQGDAMMSTTQGTEHNGSYIAGLQSKSFLCRLPDIQRSVNFASNHIDLIVHDTIWVLRKLEGNLRHQTARIRGCRQGPDPCQRTSVSQFRSSWLVETGKVHAASLLLQQLTCLPDNSLTMHELI